MAVADRVRDLVAPLAEAEGVDLYDVEHHGGVVRVLVDRDGGVDLEVLGRLTRSVSSVLDEHDPVPGRYTLEVSSPGLERPLRTPEHFRRAVGRAVKVKTTPQHPGERRVDGALVAADEEGIEVRMADGEVVRIALGDVSSARTVFEWGPTPPPGGSKRSRRRARRDAEPHHGGPDGEPQHIETQHIETQHIEEDGR